MTTQIFGDFAGKEHKVKTGQNGNWSVIFEVKVRVLFTLTITEDFVILNNKAR